MSNNSYAPNTERRYYQAPPLKDEWVSRNEATNNFFPPELGQNNEGFKTYFDNEGMTDITQTISLYTNSKGANYNQNAQGGHLGF